MCSGWDCTWLIIFIQTSNNNLHDKNLSCIQLKIISCILDKLSVVEICKILSEVENGSSDLKPFTICH